jgi:restriction system protein
MAFSMNEKGVSFRGSTTLTATLEIIKDITVLVQGIIRPYEDTEEGKLIQSVAIPWKLIVKLLKEDPRLAFQISPYKWEEMIAAAFDQAGYDKVILTPRSGDFGRDVIAVKEGIGSVRIIDSVKAYKPGHLVPQDDVRALLGVLSSDRQATKAILTTTSDFAPGITKDPFISPHIPYRLELMNGESLQKWLEGLAGI